MFKEPWLHVNVNYTNTFKEECLGHDLNAGKVTPDFEKICYLHLNAYKEKASKYSNFYAFDDFPNLLSLDLDLTNITNSKDIAKCKNLKRFTADYCSFVGRHHRISGPFRSVEYLKCKEIECIRGIVCAETFKNLVLECNKPN